MQSKYLIEINVKIDSEYVTRYERIFNDKNKVPEIVEKAAAWTCKNLD